MTKLPIKSNEAGFTLAETLIAMAIMTVGLMGLLQVFVLGMAHMASSSADVLAREKAREAVESVHAARDTRVVTWAQIRNVAGGGGGGIFLDGPQMLRGIPGNDGDGLVNTADDAALPLQAVVAPGPDGILGNSDDVRTPLRNFTREIEIRDIAGQPSLRQVRVIIRYQVANLNRTYTLTTFVSSFS
jgi:prepilin-type N-terminal cleavage/methylation domain-containing protein